MSLIGVITAKGQIFYPGDDGFETPDLLGPNFSYGDHLPAGAAWTFISSSGIAANGSTFGVTGATNGNVNGGATSTSGQAALLQSTSAIEQTLYLTAGTYEVSFDAEGRGGAFSSNELSVSLGGTQLLTFTPSSTSSFETETTAPTAFLSDGYYVLKFSGMTANSEAGDYTSFVDNVKLLVVTPEPSTMTFLIMGSVLLIGYWWYRRPVKN